MSDDVFRILKRLDMESVEVQTALQCAPLLTGIKMSNLLHVKPDQVEEVMQAFEGTPISVQILCSWDKRVSILLYRREPLKSYLNQKRVKQLLESFGYEDQSFGEILKRVSERNQAYVEGMAEYPHEIGLLLGYPPEDVTGYIENTGRNYLLAGYWKVYGDPLRAERIFHAYDRARDAVIRLVGKGFCVVDILRFYNIVKRKQLIAQI